MSNAWPDVGAAASLYLRLRTPDPLAPSDFAEALLDPLVAFLRGVAPHEDDHARLSAAEDAILSVIRNPAVYDPTQRPLAEFLKMAARADLANLRSKERRHHRGREEWDSVELPAPAGNDTPEDDDLPSFGDADLAAVVAGFTEVERAVFELMRAGEKRTDEFAGVMGLASRSAEERRREVKRVKDRIIVRLKRAREKS